MSNALASDLPVFVPAEIDRYPRHIEIVSTRHQKRARPRVVYALVAVAGLFIILMVQLLLSIWLSDGAYQISGLQQTQRNLALDQQSLGESLTVLQSPQNLGVRASALGMVVNTGSQGFLSLAGGVSRAPTPAATDTVVSADVAKLAPNALITPDISAIDAGSSGAPGPLNPAGSVASTAETTATTVLPSPITH